MQPALLDTDILSAIMRQEPSAVRRAAEYLTEHERFTVSLITRYEILRGLKAKQATAQIRAFDAFTAASLILPITDDSIARAADIYADLYRRGELIGDADILIAATALENRLTLITNNTAHFRRVNGLLLDNWLRS